MKKYILYIIGMILLLPLIYGQEISCQEADDVYFDFEEGSGNLTDECQGLTGVTFDDPEFRPSVPIFNATGDGGNFALNFPDFNDHFNFTYNITNNITISMWINISNAEVRFFRSKRGGSGVLLMQHSAANGRIEFRASRQFDDTLICGSLANGDIPTTIDGTGWHHIVFQVDGTAGNCQSWLDGVLRASVFGSGTTSNEGHHDTIGIGGGIAGGGNMRGSIDEVRIFRRFLDNATINALFNTGLVVPSPPSAPTLVSPVNNTVSSLNQTLTWTGVADSYFVFHDFGLVNATTLICDNITGLTCLANATSGEGNYSWKVISANSIGNSIESEIFNWEFDITNVIIDLTTPNSNNQTLTNVDQVLDVTISNVNLDTIIVNVTSPTGVEIFRNETNNISTFSFNINTLLPLTDSGIHTIFIFGNDSAGATATETFTFRLDNIAPIFSGLVTNGSNEAFSGDNVHFNVTIGDNFNLSSFILSVNDTGVFVNSSTFTTSGVLSTISTIITLNNPEQNATICGRYFATDQATNVNQSGLICFTSGFVPPPVIIPSDLDDNTRSILLIALPLIAVLMLLLIFREGAKAMGGK